MSIPELINKWSSHYNVRADIVAAVVVQESNGIPFAFRFEPKFYQNRIAFRNRQSLSGHVPPPPPAGVSLESEKIARATSYGPMQILGETARSVLGYTGNHLPVLFDPEINIEMGVRLLAKLLKKYSHLPEQAQYTEALTDYNGSPDYPPLIFSHIKNRRHLKFLRQET